ncbi:hypothetical protein I302_100177 [Kwoniella bestiolae CBS 10118]|uniref:Uncharacterized protein n=1 Tax=Kwoniella bestiolae CBS 10118 TaxID=1296100 RepID=A0A1B9G4A1_9TREE|nr:hypothetical protein I302_03552 [Kwoniella bestiolae CBS 10118]OCF25877.1 hypothetical protein I302_03552 [Kwoniella bestiolae CBS 10118]
MPSSFLPPISTSNSPTSSMLPFGKPPSSSNPPRPTSANGSATTSPNVPTSQLGSASRNGTPVTTPGGGSGNGLRPSYEFLTDAQRRERERARDIQSKPPYSSSYSTSLPRPSDTPSTASSHLPHHHHHHHHSAGTGSNPPSANSTPREERQSPFASTSTPGASSAPPTRKPDLMGPGFGSGLGRLGAGYGLFGAGPYIRDQEQKEKERQALIAREREREREREKERERERSTRPHSIETSPTHRNATPANPYSRPSLPPSPTTARTLAAPNSANSAGKPSISPQIPPASATSATGSTPRPNLPLPSFGSLGTRSLPSPFERDARERSTSTSIAATPNAPSGPESATSASGHRRTPSGSSARGNEPLPVGPKSPVKTTSQTAASARSLYGAPPSLNEAARSREGQRSPVSRIQTTALPRDRDATISPTTATSAPPSKNAPPSNSTASSSQSTRAPFPSYSGFGGPGYPGSFGGFGLGGFGGYGAFGPRWADREREREMLEKREEGRKRSQKEAAEARAKAEKEKEDRFADWVKERERERERISGAAAGPGNAPGNATSTAYGVEAFQPPRSNSTTTTTAQQRPSEPNWRQTPATTNEKPSLTRHIEVIHQPEPRDSTAPAPSTTGEGSSVIQQVAPSREPRPYGYKAEPREYQYTPRDKRPRMDAAVEEAQNAHRRTSNAKASKRRKEEEKKADINHNVSTGVPPKEKNWSSLTNPVRQWPEVGSSQVEQWLKSVPDLNKVISNQVYTGSEWTLAKSGECTADNEGGLIIVRIGGGFLGEDWKVRGENGWDESSSAPPTGSGSELGDGRRKIWGTDVYTDDSDLGLILVHAGWLRWSNPAQGINGEQRKGKNPRDQDIINVTVRLVPRLIRYTATERNGVRTRGWGNGHDGSSIVVERAERIAVDKRYLKTRKRKSVISEWARQRQLVSPLAAISTEGGDVQIEDASLAVEDGVNDSIMFCTRVPGVKSGDTESIGFVYTPEAFDDWLKSPLETADRTLWSHTLVFQTTDEAKEYKLSLSSTSSIDNPLFDLLKPSTTEDGEVVLERSFDDIHLLKEGIAVRLQGNRGLLIKPKIWNWAALAQPELRDGWKEEFELRLKEQDEGEKEGEGVKDEMMVE